MCIAIYKPAGLVLTEETIKTSWLHNSDGAGFMYHEDNQLHVTKGLMSLKDFEEAYEPHKEKETVVHFRIKTHGNKDAANTHPFLVDQDLGMVHNGIISNVDTKVDPTKSDTWHFTDFHLHRFRQDNPKFFLNPIYKDMIEEYIGYSKLIFMDAQGNVEIFNENKGVWDAGCWFSNTTYKPYKKPEPKKLTYTKPQSPWSSEKPKDNSWSTLQTGDTVKLLQVAYGTISKGEILLEQDTIPIGSYMEIMYFKQNNMVGVREILTGLEAVLPIDHLEPAKITILNSGDQYEL